MTAHGDMSPWAANGRTYHGVDLSGPAFADLDLTPLQANRRPAPELPLDILGPFWADWVRKTAENASAPPDYVFGHLIALTGSLLSNVRRASPWAGWVEPPTIWTALIGDPSSGKSPATDPLTNIARLIEADMAANFEGQMREFETRAQVAHAKKAAWEDIVAKDVKEGRPAVTMPDDARDPEPPVRPRLIANDTTIEALAAILAGNPRGLLFTRDELSGWLGGMDRYSGAGGERGFWIESYGGRRYVVDRVRIRKPLIIPFLSVGVFGGLQPDKLASGLLVGDDDGMAARFLFIWPEKVEPRRPNNHPNMDAARAALSSLTRLQMGTDEMGEPAPMVLKFSDAAAAEFQAWREEHFRRDAAGMLASAFGKAPGHVVRLATVLEFLWWSATSNPAPDEISHRAVTAALGLYDEYFRPMAERAFGDAALPDRERRAATLAKWIYARKPDVLNARELRRNIRLPGLRDQESCSDAIQELVEAGWLTSPVVMTEERGKGRPPANFIVNPRLWMAT